MTARRTRILGVSGSLRANSSNTALLREVARAATAAQVTIAEGIAELPAFNPDLDGFDEEPPPRVARWRAVIEQADALVISAPEYAHGVPGALKNALDWLVSTPLMQAKPIALLNAAPAGGIYAQHSLAETLRTMGARIVEEASLMEPFVGGRIAGELDEGAFETLRGCMERFVEAIETSKM